MIITIYKYKVANNFIDWERNGCNLNAQGSVVAATHVKDVDCDVTDKAIAHAPWRPQTTNALLRKNLNLTFQP